MAETPSDAAQSASLTDIAENRSQAAARDAEGHLHPYSNLRQVEEAGPHVITGGNGIRIQDETGRSYIEGMSGLWCAGLGFSETRLAEAAYRQMLQLPYYHSFNGRVPEVVTELVEEMRAWSPIPDARVLFANSGSESNDAAFKLVHYINTVRGRPEKTKIIGRELAYHGTTAAAVAMSGLEVGKKVFNLNIPDILRVSAPHYYRFGLPGESEAEYVERLAQELEDTIQAAGPETVAAFIAEPVIGGGGVIIPPEGYFEQVQEILRKYDILFIADEVICGFGRLGAPFGSTHFGLSPDIVTVAKQLSSAYAPISALYVSPALYESAREGSDQVGAFAHGFTYSGHPVSAAVALETLRIYKSDAILDHVAEVAPVLAEGLARLADHPLVGQARSLGLIGALELAEDPATRKPFPPGLGVAAHAVKQAEARGLILRATPGDVIAFSPPLIITAAEISEILAITEAALDETLAWVRALTR